MISPAACTYYMLLCVSGDGAEAGCSVFLFMHTRKRGKNLVLWRQVKFVDLLLKCTPECPTPTRTVKSRLTTKFVHAAQRATLEKPQIILGCRTRSFTRLHFCYSWSAGQLFKISVFGGFLLMYRTDSTVSVGDGAT